MDSATIIAIITALATLIGAVSPIIVTWLQSNKEKQQSNGGILLPGNVVLHRPNKQMRWLTILFYAFIGGAIGYGGATLAYFNSIDTNSSSPLSTSNTPQPTFTSTNQSTLSSPSETPQPTTMPNVQGLLSSLSSESFTFLLRDGTDKYGYDGYFYTTSCPTTLDDFFALYEGIEQLYILRWVEVYSVSDKYCEQSLRWKWTRHGVSIYIDTTELIANPNSDFRKMIEQQILSTDIKHNLEGLSKVAFIHLLKYANGRFSGYGRFCDSTKESFYAVFPGLEELETKNLIVFYTDKTSSCEAELFWRITNEGSRTINYIMPLILNELSIEQ